MGKLLAALAVLSAIFAPAASSLIADEFKEWTPWIVRKLLAASVQLLPVIMRERYSEEWSSYLEEIPGYAGKLVGSIGLLFAALRVHGRAKRTQEKLDRLFERWINSRLHQPGPTWLIPDIEELRATLDRLLKESLRSIEVNGDWARVEAIERPFIRCCDAYDTLLKSEPKQMDQE